MVPILCLIFVLGCNGQEDFYSRARNFSIDIINQTNLDDVALAPFSIWSLMAGAALFTYGDYQATISKSLILPSNKSKLLEDYRKLKRIVLNERTDYIDLDNGMIIFIDKNFYVLPEFEKTMKNYFDADIASFDFEDKKNIASITDQYIEDRHPHIINIFHAEDFVNASMIMCNVIKFSGYWKTRFGILNTVEETFYLENNPQPYTVMMMQQKMKIPFSNMDAMDAEVMELPLGSYGKFSLLLIFPHENKTLREVYNNFGKVTLLNIFDKLENDVKESGLKEMNVKLPRVRIQTNIVLNKELADIGLNEVFQSEDSKFSGITNEGIYISSVDHKTEFVMRETGVYVSSSTPGFYDYPIGTPKLEAEKSFIYFIVEKTTKTILFGGLYSKARYI